MSFFPSEALLEKYAPLSPAATCPSINVHQAPDFFRFWDALEEEQGEVCDVPYWGVVWPGAASMTRYILSHRELVQGKSVLDFGCGGGIMSITAALCGASKVMANDVDPSALYIAKKNSNSNNLHIITEDRNWLLEKDAPVYDLVLASDMFYERSSASGSLEFLLKCKSKGAQVLIADASRPFAPGGGVKKIQSEMIAVDKELEGRTHRMVHLLNLL